MSDESEDIRRRNMFRLEPAPKVFTQAELDGAVQAARDEHSDEIRHARQMVKEAFAEAEQRFTKPSPCGQKFSDGTPHPASLWREKSEYHAQPFYNGPDMKLDRSVCLICQSHEELRDALYADLF